MTDINIIENWYEEKGEKIKNVEFSDEPIIVPHTEEEYVTLNNIYVHKCSKCGFDIEIIQNNKESLNELLDYIVQKAHIENTYDSFVQFKDDVKIDIDLPNNRDCLTSR